MLLSYFDLACNAFYFSWGITPKLSVLEKNNNMVTMVEKEQLNVPVDSWCFTVEALGHPLKTCTINQFFT